MKIYPVPSSLYILALAALFPVTHYYVIWYYALISIFYACSYFAIQNEESKKEFKEGLYEYKQSRKELLNTGEVIYFFDNPLEISLKLVPCLAFLYFGSINAFCACLACVGTEFVFWDYVKENFKM